MTVSLTGRRSPRPIVARRSVLTGAVAGIGLAASGRVLWAETAGEGGEAGEGAALAALPDAVEFLSLLGLFEAQHRIIAALYAEGAVAVAGEHLEASHHASYEDIEAGIEALGAPEFEEAAEDFAALIRSGADAAAVQAAAEGIFAAIDEVRERASDKDQMKAAEALLRVAASDLEAGMDGGTVSEAQEYRDAWGFATVALRWLEDLAGDDDATVAEAAAAALSGKADVEAQFAGVNATAAPGDAGALLAAAARTELAAFRLK